MGDILNNYMEEIERNADYVSFDILDSDVNNPSSVEALYQQIEKFIEDNIQVVKFESLVQLENEYDKIYAWFGKNFEQKLENIVQIIDKEHPLRLPNELENPILNNSKVSAHSDQKSNKEDMKNKFKSYKNSFHNNQSSQSKTKNTTITTNLTINDESKKDGQNMSN